MFLATERACGSKKHTARITMISLGGCPGHLRGWNGTTRRTEALTDTSRRQGTGRHPIPGCRSNCARRPDGLDGERARPRGHAAAEQRLTRPGPGGNPVCSSRAKVLVSTAYLRARPQKVDEKTRTHLARVCGPRLWLDPSLTLTLDTIYNFEVGLNKWLHMIHHDPKWSQRLWDQKAARSIWVQTLV